MKSNSLLVLILLIWHSVSSQIIPQQRRTDWSLSGYQGNVPVFHNMLDITFYGGNGDGVSVNDSAMQSAIAALNGTSGTIYFPPGNFLFHSAITLPDSVVIKGATADSTTLSFDLNGSGDLIRIAGNISGMVNYTIADAYQGGVFVTVDDSAAFEPDDYIKIFQNDSLLVTSNWAYKSVGQIARVKSKDGHRLELYSPLRKTYSMSDNTRVQKITPRTTVGIECLKIKRLDATVGQSNNIDLNYAAKCWVKGVESDSTNFAHIAISNSTNIEVTGCYLHNAFAYGGGGQAYGALVQFTSGECLIENNIFNRLRHSMLLQAGANGNVFAYNSSANPHWVSGVLPANSAGDMVLHGNYVFMNLFEGNIGQNIVIDDSHGKNGPYNTFFRNRADLYGIFMNNNPPSDSQNFAGNEITNTGFLMGMYQLNGTGHFAYGNNVKGTTTPINTSSLSDSSYYLYSSPAFWNEEGFPTIGYPNTISSGTIPAQLRLQGMPVLTDCRIEYPVISNLPTFNNESLIQVYPNPGNGLLWVYYSGQGDLSVRITDIAGALVAEIPLMNSATINVADIKPGIYLMQFLTNGQLIETKKIVLVE